MEKTIPIQVQHERSRSEPVAAEQTGFSSSPNNSATGSNNIPHDPRMHPFMPDNSYFQHKFQSPFSGVPSEGSHSSVPAAGSEGGEPRVHRIPIQVETRSATGNGPVPMGYTKSPSPTQSGTGAGHYASSQSGAHPSQSNLHPQQQHPPQQPFISARSTSSSPFDSKSAAAAGRNIEIPIQIAKSSSSPAPSKKVDSSFQGAANQSVNESASDPAIADPNQVYAMGYEPLSASGAQNNQNAEKSASEAKKETPFDYVDEILYDLKNFESQVHEFNGTSHADKGYRFLDEMLTLCILRLDCINIDGNDELRKYRKSAIIEVNRVAAILETKVSKADKSAVTENTPSQQNDSQGQQQQCNSDAATQPNGSFAPQKPEDNQTAAGASTAESAAEPKNKKEAKKLEKAKAKREKEEKEKAKKEAAAGEKKEGRRIILFRGKNKAKAAAQNTDETTASASGTSEAMDLDTNNNDLKDGNSSTTGSQTASSDQASETASSTTSSTTTLQGKETAV